MLVYASSIRCGIFSLRALPNLTLYCWNFPHSEANSAVWISSSKSLKFTASFMSHTPTRKHTWSQFHCWDFFHSKTKICRYHWWDNPHSRTTPQIYKPFTCQIKYPKAKGRHSKEIWSIPNKVDGKANQMIRPFHSIAMSDHTSEFKKHVLQRKSVKG